MHLSIVCPPPPVGAVPGGFDHENHPEGGAFDHMIIRCYSIYGGVRWEI